MHLLAINNKLSANFNNGIREMFGPWLDNIYLYKIAVKTSFVELRKKPNDSGIQRYCRNILAFFHFYILLPISYYNFDIAR